MKFFSSFAVLLLSSITLSAAAPVPRDSDALDLFDKRASPEYEVHQLVARTTSKGPKVKMTGGAKTVLANSGLDASHFGGHDPIQHHLDHVANHIAGDTSLSGYKKAAITAPYHQGGHGGGGHAPDPNNHATVKLSGGGHPPQTIHVPAPHGAPSVASHHFGHRKREFEEKGRLVARTKVRMTGGAKTVLANSGMDHTHFGGKDPVQHHVDHVANHIASNPHLSGYKKAAITAPYHEGGHGGGGHAPDPTNHATVKLSGGGHPAQTIHVPAPHGAPTVASHHFGHRKREFEEKSRLVARTKVRMTGGAKTVLANSGMDHTHFGGKDPVQHHVDHVANHIASNPHLSGYKKAAITAPYHEGGHGGGGHAPDPTNHATVKLSGGGHAPQTIHVPAPHGAPTVASHHFGH